MFRRPQLSPKSTGGAPRSAEKLAPIQFSRFNWKRAADIDIDWDGEDEPPSDYWTGPDDGYAFYITVRNAEISFGTAYDGYWGNADNTLEEAVEQALLGSCLIDESQRKFGRPAP